jgi:putative IMPACT (imprinted ancient) family translation regulator
MKSSSSNRALDLVNACGTFPSERKKTFSAAVAMDILSKLERRLEQRYGVTSVAGSGANR